MIQLELVATELLRIDEDTMLLNEEGEHSYFIEYLCIPIVYKRTQICYSIREVYFYCRYLMERQDSIHIERIYDEQRLPLYFDGMNLSREKGGMR